MDIFQLRDVIFKKIETILSETIKKVEEKSVPQPYDRKSARKMTASQIARRDTIGNAMLNNQSTVKYFKKMHGSEWEDYLWATASGKALQGE
jgi:hypothetical protein